MRSYCTGHFKELTTLKKIKPKLQMEKGAPVMKKILFTATVDSHILSFHLPYLKYFKMNGYEVHVASNGQSQIPFVDKKYTLPFERSPLRKGNITAFVELKKIIENNDYSIIHCHTPMGGVITRLAAKHMRKNGTKVIYTAHGFHFFKGAPILNWLLYYPVEKWLSKYTDCLITINDEDYQRAVNKRFKTNLIKKVNGVGINLNRFFPASKQEKTNLRKEYNLTVNDFVLVYAAELNDNKHQDLLINAVHLLKDKIPTLKLLLAGDGELEKAYKEMVKKLEMEDMIIFMGYRKDMAKIFAISDVAVSASKREGLPVNIMEAMATGLPLVVTNCRGNRDLVADNRNGYVIGIDDVERFSHAIDTLYKSTEKRMEFAEQSLKLVKNFSIEQVLVEVAEIYEQVLGHPLKQDALFQYSSSL
jgi:glycosyltransferase EpsD